MARRRQSPGSGGSRAEARGRLRWPTPLAAAALIGLTVMAYLPVTDAGYVWDDDVYVEHNPHLRSPDGLRRVWLDIDATPQYYPLVHTTFWLEYRLWGSHAAGYHWVNVLLHAAGALLLWRVLVLLQLPAAWAVAAVFALHPVQVESVAWITERKNVLSGALYFGAALAYLRFALAGRRRSRTLYGVSLLLFLGALLSKTVTASLPAALLLVLWWRQRAGRGDLAALAPFFALGALLGSLTVWIEKALVGASGVSWDLSLLERCLIAGRALWFYLGKLLWPARLTFIYPRWSVDAADWRHYLWPLAAAAVVAVLWLGRRRLGRGPLVAALFFGGTLLPALGFFDVYPMQYSFVADHFQYLASVGPIALVVVAARAAARRPEPSGRGLRAVVLFSVLVTLGALTWRQGGAYRDEETLWRDTLAKNPAAWMAHNNLGMLLQSRGDLEEAIRHYRRTVELFPEYAFGHNNLGTAEQERGDLETAERRFRRALEIDPEYAKAHYNLAAVVALAGRLDEAVDHYRRALQIRPDYASAHNNLANTLAMQGDLEAAVRHYRQSLSLRPGAANTHFNLGAALARSGDGRQALEHFEEASRLRPSWPAPLLRSAWLLITDPAVLDPRRAVERAEHAVSLVRDVQALDTLAAAYAAAGRDGDAVRVAEQALELATARGDAAVPQLSQRVETYRRRALGGRLNPP